MRLRTRPVLRILLFALALSSVPWTLAQQPKSESPVELVRKTVQNEVRPADERVKFMFTERKETPRGSQTKLLVETREAMAGMVIAINDLFVFVGQADGDRSVGWRCCSRCFYSDN